MKNNAGLWVDHREAIIVVLTDAGEDTKRIVSGVERQLRRVDGPSEGRFKAHEAPVDDSREREFHGHLAPYYEEIVAHLRDAGSILILGPGEAKGELLKKFEKHKGEARSFAVEKAGHMTQPQVVALVRRHFSSEAARRAV